MDTAPLPGDHAPVDPPETAADRQRRIAWKSEGIAKARVSVAAGYYATSAKIKAWIDSRGTDQPLPVPYPQQSRPR